MTAESVPAAGWGRQLLPTPAGTWGPIHGRPLLPPAPAHRERPYLALNMVATVDGRAAVDGTALGLGSPSDQRLMRLLRAEADAVMHGAGTVRAHHFTPRVPDDLAAQRVARGLSPQPVGVLVSGSGDVSLDHPYLRSARADWPRIIYTAKGRASAIQRPGIDVCVLPGPPIDPVAIVRDLAARGLRRVVCEGGPTLNGPFFAAGVVDELFLTLAPRLDGGRDPLTLVVGDRLPPVGLTLRSLYERDSELFMRFATVP